MALPNLKVTFLSALTPVPEQGGFTITYRVSEVNGVGTAASSNWPDILMFFVISEDQIFDGGDKYLRSPSISHFSAFESRALSVDAYLDVWMGSFTPGRTYYLLAVVDAFENVAESNEFDNVLALPIRIGGGPPPLFTEGADIVTVPSGGVWEALGGDDIVRGSSESDFISGDAGNDLIYGAGNADLLWGGDGNDTLVGGAGVDVMRGGSGFDIFDFNSRRETTNSQLTCDVIVDFEHLIDRIDLRTIDASTLRSGNNSFVWRGTGGFSTSTAGEVRYRQFDNAGTDNDYTLIYGDTDADRASEFQIKLEGLVTLTSADFYL